MDVLDAIRESDDAFALVTLIPWRWAVSNPDRPRRVLLWTDSALELACAVGSERSAPCMQFVQHRHTQYALDKYFCGDYPGSYVRIPQAASLPAILLQAILPFLPGLVVETAPCSMPPNQLTLKGKSVTKRYQSFQKGQLQNRVFELDPELNLKKHLAKAYNVLGIAQSNVEEVVVSAVSFGFYRHLLFYLVPKVKFTIHFTSHLFLAAFVSYMPFDKHPTRAFQAGGRDILTSEIIFFIWCLNRSIGELAELQSFTMEGLLIYASSHWNQIDLISSALLTVTTCLRLTGHGDSIWHGPLDSRGPWLDHNANDPNAPWGDHLPANLTALMVILIYYRILQYLRCNESVGVLTIVLNQMVRER